MKKKDVLELKKRFKKDYATFTKMCGCYVNGEKNTLLKFRETFLNLEEDEYFKYLEIAKKILSGTIGNNLLDLSFPLDESYVNESQIELLNLKNSKLKNDEELDKFYNKIISNYDYTGNYIILVFHDCYDIITKTKDNLKVDESEEVFEYLLCAICPVSLTEPGLRYFEEENKIAARVRDWVVEAPINGFVYPAFVERSTDVNSLMYYTKNPKDTHEEFMEDILGCYRKKTTTVKKIEFQEVIIENLQVDEEKSKKIFMEVQDSINTIIEEHNAIYEDTPEGGEPLPITTKEIKEILVDNGISEEETIKIEKSFEKTFGDDITLAEDILDNKILKLNEQRKKEAYLMDQVEVLKTRLKEVEVATDLETEDNGYDVIVQVNEEKLDKIKAEYIQGQRYLIIPVEENEQTQVKKK